MKESKWLPAILVACGIIIVLQLLSNHPLTIEYVVTDCPEVICKDVKCECDVDIELINRTQWIFNLEQPEPIFWNWSRPGSSWVYNVNDSNEVKRG